MTAKIKLFLLSFLLGATFISFSQVENITLNMDKVKKFEPYLAAKLGYTNNQTGFQSWKSSHMLVYTKEMWYYSESFYIKRNHLSQGITLDESIIDIGRFEKNRLQNSEAIVTLPGFKDVIVLLPTNKLIYVPTN